MRLIDSIKLREEKSKEEQYLRELKQSCYHHQCAINKSIDLLCGVGVYNHGFIPFEFSELHRNYIAKYGCYPDEYDRYDHMVAYLSRESGRLYRLHKSIVKPWLYQ